APAWCRTIHGSHSCLRFGPDEQGAGDYVPVCSSAAGLLASRSLPAEFWARSRAIGRSGQGTGRPSGPRPVVFRPFFFRPFVREFDLGEGALVCAIGGERAHHLEGGGAGNPIKTAALDTPGKCGSCVC